jgi:hypothetical protein
MVQTRRFPRGSAVNYGIVMNFSAEKSSRKWPFGAFRRIAAALVTVGVAALLVAPADPAMARRASHDIWGDLFGVRPKKPRKAAQRAAIPLPRPRPAEAPSAAPEKKEAEKPAAKETGKDVAKESSKEADKPAEPPAPPPPSACRLALTDTIAIAPSIPDIRGPGGCGGEDLVRLEAIVLPDKRQVPVKPAAILRCKMATAVAEWIRSDIAPLAEKTGSPISEFDNFDSYQCRGRNNVAGAMMSEHGRANALDVRGFKLANGRMMSLTDRNLARETRESVLHSACTRFSTVLGPVSDWYHEDHIHLDVMERRNNYRICQWNVWDPLPQIAPLLPAGRPEEAPPREVAEKSDAKKESAKSGDAEKAEAKPEPDKSESKKQATKKRR